MGHDRDYTEALAETTVKLLHNGTPDPSCEDIAEAHFPDQPLGGEISSGIAKRLHLISGTIISAYPEISLAFVSQVYYRRYRRQGVQTMADAKMCLPKKGSPSYGLFRCTNDDLIWVATIARNLTTGGGKLHHNLDRILGAHTNSDLSTERASELLREASAIAQPSDPEAARTLLAQAEQLLLEVEQRDRGEEPFELPPGEE